MAKRCNLVLAGGGVKGIALVGAIEVLEEAGYSFSRVAGTSAGAVVGGLLAAGYKSDELKDIMYSVPYEEFRDEGWLGRLGAPGKIAALYFKKGIYQGDFFCRWYDGLLEQKQASTFADLKIEGEYSEHQNYGLVAMATNISQGRLLRLPWDLPEYGITTDKQSISGAVRASISLPAFYQPVKVQGDYLVDGGILSNFPFGCFEGDDLPTIGIKLSAEPGASDRAYHINGPISYGSAVMKTILNSQDQIHLDDPAVVAQTIFVDTKDVMTTDFDLSRQQQQMLYEAGRAGAKKFLSRKP